LTFELKVRDRKHLARIVRVIHRMPDIVRVSRSIAAHARDRGDDIEESEDESEEK
jgi:hypothetical protein